MRPSRASAAAQRAFAMIAMLVLAPPQARQAGDPPDRRERAASDRGDVPGWVMITMMTAIVVIVLIGVFQDAVVTAVKNAFNSITGP